MSRNPPGVDEDAEEGVWYFVWLAPHWELMYRLGSGSEASHLAFWNEHVAERIRKHYKIKKNSEAARLIENAYRSMPRGRVVEKDNEFILAHGEDLPIDRQEALDSIISVFGLTNRHILGHVKNGFHSHETMLPEHQWEISRALKLSIPYLLGGDFE